MSNEELIQKASTIISTDLAGGGKLNPVQSDRFIDYVVDETVLKEHARVVKFRPEQMEIDKIGVGRRVAFPKAEATDPGIRRGITTGKVVLQPREVCVPFELSDIIKEINIEGDNLEDTIVKLMARQFANDLEELYILGDTTGPAIIEDEYKGSGSTTQYVKDGYLALQDGWQRLADGANLVDAEGANIGLSIFSAMLRAMPTKFRRDKSRLRFYMSPDLAQLYLEKLATRATMIGDEAVKGSPARPFGVPIVEVPLWDLTPKVVEHLTLTATDVIPMRYAPVQDVVVLPDTLADTATTPFVEDTDYSIDYTNGTITRIGTGAIGAGDTVKVTYNANPQILLTHQMNWIVGIGRDIRIERDRNIYKGVNEYNITAKVSVEFEELTAIVKAKNVGQAI
jgi:hypothetical protein